MTSPNFVSRLRDYTYVGAHKGMYVAEISCISDHTH